MNLNGNMGIVSIFLGLNLYVVLVSLMHRMFSDKHGDVKALVFGNLVLLGAFILVFLLLF